MKEIISKVNKRIQLNFMKDQKLEIEDLITGDKKS